MQRALRSTAALLFLCGLAHGSLPAQSPGQTYRTEAVTYRNARDSRHLTASLMLPSGPGPHRGVVLLSIAGTVPLVDRLVQLGYAVLIPVRRGFVEVEPLLQATYADLAGDAQAAVDYLRSRADVDGGALSIVAQADDAPPAMVASAGSSDALPLVLLAPPGFPGRDVFRLEQRGLAESDGLSPQALAALDRLLDEIASIVLGESTYYGRRSRLEALIGASTARLPYNAAFPRDERQIHFFASPLWHDRMAFEPEQALAKLQGPVLVLIGTEDPNMTLPAYLAAVRRGLRAASTEDAMVCLLEGRTRHTFSDAQIEAIVGWLEDRAGRGCLPEPGRN